MEPSLRYIIFIYVLKSLVTVDRDILKPASKSVLKRPDLNFIIVRRNSSSNDKLCVLMGCVTSSSLSSLSWFVTINSSTFLNIL